MRNITNHATYTSGGDSLLNCTCTPPYKRNVELTQHFLYWQVCYLTSEESSNGTGQAVQGISIRVLDTENVISKHHLGIRSTLQLSPVLRIRIRIRNRIRMFFCLLDPDPLVRGMDPDPDPDPSIDLQK